MKTRVDTFYYGISRKQAKVTILAAFALINDYLRAVLESDRGLNVLDTAGTGKELLRKVAKNKPDAVLICLMEDEFEDLDIIARLREIAPLTKIVVLTDPNNRFDQRTAVTHGVTGIVSSRQGFRVLIRAIYRVIEGGVWLNQKLVAELLKKHDIKIDQRKSSNKSYYRSDELTPRELEVVEKVGLGLNNKDISEKLYISEATVRHHLSSIYGKLNVEDRLNLAIYAFRQGIVQPPIQLM